MTKGVNSLPQTGGYHQQHGALSDGHVGVGKTTASRGFLYPVLPIPIFCQHKTLGNSVKLSTSLANRKRNCSDCLLITRSMAKGEVIGSPWLEGHLIPGHQLLQCLAHLDEAGHVVFHRKAAPCPAPP